MMDILHSRRSPIDNIRAPRSLRLQRRRRSAADRLVSFSYETPAEAEAASACVVMAIATADYTDALMATTSPGRTGTGLKLVL
jgi:hypothetical protein